LIKLYRGARALPDIKKIFIASGLRYDLAVELPEYVKEQVTTHHVGDYLKIASEHTEQGQLSKMMKPGMGNYDRFKEMFDKYSRETGKVQYLIPYFIDAPQGTTDNEMLKLAVWLKGNGFRADQVQAFLCSPMSIATRCTTPTKIRCIKSVVRLNRWAKFNSLKQNIRVLITTGAEKTLA
jgi:radical SAM superfamily enzyme YgiQ (UPF0313 family)